ncbi:hypothetical protein T440DRAFT_489208 [Plenodomus tracheiphilus IPT5]|uniref:Uncharacterized protein n=1 Tax=Plenodomus tracheiphilus IPT5 TaxID=1408161 RepID=A0A6A7B8Y2_9PLEO|nr:hypothetical protein T440DRAFT_489208 [Plenodomus tracheiphilus IPT5]
MTIELPQFGQSTLKRLSVRAGKEIALLSEMFRDVQDMREKETSEDKTFTYQSAGFLLALPGDMAIDFVMCLCEDHASPRFGAKMNEGQKKQMRLQFTRMKSRARPKTGANNAEKIWKEITGWGKMEEKRKRLKDLANLMQLGDHYAAEVFRRLKIKAEYEEIAEGEKNAAEGSIKADLPETATSHDHNHSSTVNTNPPMQNTAKNTRKRQADDEDQDARSPEAKKATEPKKRRKIFEPWVGDWKCSLCGFWNSSSCGICLSKRECEGRKTSHTAEVQLDDGHHRKRYNPDEDPNVFAGDWKCNCGRWKPSFSSECNCGWCKNSSNRIMQPGPNKRFRRDEYINNRNPAFAW